MGSGRVRHPDRSAGSEGRQRLGNRVRHAHRRSGRRRSRCLQHRASSQRCGDTPDDCPRPNPESATRSRHRPTTLRTRASRRRRPRASVWQQQPSPTRNSPSEVLMSAVSAAMPGERDAARGVPAVARDRVRRAGVSAHRRASVSIEVGRVHPSLSGAASPRRPHRRCTEGSACRRAQPAAPRRGARAPTSSSCRRRTEAGRSCETGSSTTPDRPVHRTGTVPRIVRREPRTRTGGCPPSPSPAGPRRAARATTWIPARQRGARPSDSPPAAESLTAKPPRRALPTSPTPWPKTTRNSVSPSRLSPTEICASLERQSPRCAALH